MIEINLIPDVKQELIRAKKVRNLVVSGAIIAGVASIAIVVLLAVYLFGVQTLRSSLADSAIKDKSSKLKEIPDLANMLTIQNQLANISSLHDNANTSSRLFELLTAINPAKPNQVTFSLVRLDSNNKMIHLDAQAPNGYVAAEVLKKTIGATSVRYAADGKTTTEPVAKSIALSNQTYGEDSTGAKVLRFSLDFEYNDSLFAATLQNATVTRPDRQDATDSYKRLPESLFGARASDIGNGQ